MTTHQSAATAGVKHAPKYVGLQVLRFVAAAFVVAYHATTIASEKLGGIQIWKKGGYGIDLFFVLSGFVIVWSSASLFGVRDGWLTFAERRAVRVVPMYWVATALKAIAMIAAGSMVVHARLSLGTLLASLFFIPSRNLDGNFQPILGVGWTLNYEMFFYALFTLALALRRNVYRFVGITLCILAIGSCFRQPWWPWPSFYLNSLILEFFFGMLIGRACLLRKHLPFAVAAPLLIASFIMLLTPTRLDALPPVVPEGIPAALIILSVASLESVLPRIPKLLLFLADSSYAIYLFHLLAAQIPAVLMAKRHIYHPWIAVVLSIALSLTVGGLVHQFFERPMTNYFRDRLRVRHEKIIQRA